MKKILCLCVGWGNSTIPIPRDKYQVTAIEHIQQIAIIYQKRFPQDKVIVQDAFEYLRNYFTEFDIIYATPDCTSHSKYNLIMTAQRYNGNLKRKPGFPDMSLYGLIYFLQHHFRGTWLVENVNPYYEPLIKPTAQVGRHLIWSNKNIKSIKHNKRDIYDDFSKNCEIKDFPRDLLKQFKPGFQRRKNKLRAESLLRSLMSPWVAKYLWNCIKEI